MIYRWSSQISKPCKYESIRIPYTHSERMIQSSEFINAIALITDTRPRWIYKNISVIMMKKLYNIPIRYYPEISNDETSFLS